MATELARRAPNGAPATASPLDAYDDIPLLDIPGDLPVIDFWESVDRTAECWIWQRARVTGGYGTLRVNGQTVYAHRLSYQLFSNHGVPISAGLYVCHTCDNPPCVRPDHLWLGSSRDNQLDRVAKGRHFALTDPERLARGERHGSRTRPQSRPRGERHPAARLTAQQVLEIRRRGADGPRGIGRQLAREFGVSNQTVSRVLTGRNWGSVDD